MIDKIIVWFEELQNTALGRLSIVLGVGIYLIGGSLALVFIGEGPGPDDSVASLIIVGVLVVAGGTILIIGVVALIAALIDWILNGY